MQAMSSVNLRKHKHERGFSLIEAMVAVVILSIGLLGVAALQAKALRNNLSANERSMAVIQAYSIFDAMRANALVASAGGYNFTRTSNCTAPTSTSNPNTLALNDLSAWIVAMQSNLGSSACGDVSCSAGACTVKVYWNDQHGTGGSAGQFVEVKGRI